MILYAMGDSMTAGAEIQEHGDMNESNKSLAYPMYVANALGYDYCENMALAGAPNEFILRRAVQDLDAMLQKRSAEDIRVLIGWSSIMRGEISIKEHMARNPMGDKEWYTNVDSHEMFLFDSMFINVNTQHSEHLGDGSLAVEHGTKAKDFFAEYIWDFEKEYERWFSYINLMQNYLENKNIKYIFHNTVHGIEVHNRVINNPRYYMPKNAMNEWCTENKYERRKLGHPVEQAHGDYADLLVEYIKNEKLF